ncbi:hypothetical protein HWV62_45170 [Athelia sp. TMB]|nr:hypothetical protein HWV62_45170 [Athelia sp. TMB]
MPFWKLNGSILHLECLLADGHTWISTKFDLNSCIGNLDGRLSWDSGAFSLSTRQETARIEGTVLVGECKRAHSEDYVETRLDLATRLRNNDGVIVVLAKNEDHDVKPSSDAGPDFSDFSAHPAVRSAMARIAQMTANHVAKQMAAIMEAAIADATAAATASAMGYTSQSMEAVLSNIGREMAAGVD